MLRTSSRSTLKRKGAASAIERGAPPGRLEGVDARAHERELLGEVLDLQTRPREAHGVVEADRDQEDLPQEEDERARGPGSGGAGQRMQQVEAQAQDQERRRDAHPDGRVLLAQAAPPHEPEDGGDEREAAGEGDRARGARIRGGEEDLAELLCGRCGVPGLRTSGAGASARWRAAVEVESSIL